MKRWNVGYSMFGSIVVEAEDEKAALETAGEVLDEATMGFGPEVDGIDWNQPEPAADWERITVP